MFFYLFPCHKNDIVSRESTWWSHTFGRGIADRDDLLIIQPWLNFCTNTAQKLKFSVKDFFSKYEQLRSFVRFGHIYWRNPQWKTSFFVRCKSLSPEAATGGGLLEKMCFKISQNSQKNKPHVCKFIKKETLAQVFSCEFCKNSKNTFIQNISGNCFGKSLYPT